MSIRRNDFRRVSGARVSRARAKWGLEKSRSLTWRADGARGGSLVPVPFRFVPPFRSPSVARKNGAALRPVHGTVVPAAVRRVRELQVCIRARACAQCMCMWRVRGGRVFYARGTRSRTRILLFFIRVAVKREAKTSRHTYTLHTHTHARTLGKWRCTVV